MGKVLSPVSSVVDLDPDPLGSAFIWLFWIRIRFGNANPDQDPGARKLTNKQINLNSRFSKRLLY
jgi:hypothetical protein